MQLQRTFRRGAAGLLVPAAIPYLRHLWVPTRLNGQSVRGLVNLGHSRAHGLLGVGGGSTTGTYYAHRRYRGQICDAISLDPTGTGTYNSFIMLVGDAAGTGAPQNGPFTIEAVFSTGQFGYGQIYGSDFNVLFESDASTSKLRLVKPGSHELGLATTVLSANTTYHAAVTFDGTGVNFYLNGSHDGAASSTTTFAAAQYAVLGRGTLSSTDGWQGGWIAYVAVWDRVLSRGEMLRRAHEPFAIWRPEERRTWLSAGGAGGVLAGSAALSFGEGASSLTGDGALAGASALTFDDGASTLTASGALAGSAAFTFGEGASSLTATGTLTGQIDLTFDDGASALTGAGALAGAAAIVFANTGSLTDLTAGSIAGTAALTFTDTATATGAGALAGSSAITFTTAATAAGAGALAGAAALTFTNAGDLTNATSGAITGTAGLVFAEVAALTGAGALAGSAAMQLTASAVISGGAFVTADRRFIAPTRSRSFNLSRSRVFRSE